MTTLLYHHAVCSDRLDPGTVQKVRTAADLTEKIHNGLKSFNPRKIGSSGIGKWKPVANGIKVTAWSKPFCLQALFLLLA